MPLSPLAQYCIRNLLRQSTDNLAQLFIPNSSVSGLSEINLDRALYQLSFEPKSHGTEVVELELLIKLYQQYENTPANATSLIEIKRRICQVLGFQTSTILFSKLPPIIEINSIEQFCFFYQRQTRKGIRYNNGLFGAVKSFTLSNRLHAYQTAWALSEAKVSIVLTLAPAEFIIWVNLQSPVYSILLQQDTTMLRTLLVLTSAFSKCKLSQEKQSSKLQSLARNRIR